MSCALYSVLAVCRDQSRPNRRAQARRSATKRDRIDAPSTPQHDRITTDCDQSRPIARKHALARLSTTNHDQSRPNRRAKHALARLSTPQHDQARPNRRANHDRIDAPIATESTRASTPQHDQSRPNRRANRRANHDRIEKSRPNRANRTTPLHPFLSGERNSILVLSIFSPYTALFYKSLVKKRRVGLGS